MPALRFCTRCGQPLAVAGGRCDACDPLPLREVTAVEAPAPEAEVTAPERVREMPVMPPPRFCTRCGQPLNVAGGPCAICDPPAFPEAIEPEVRAAAPELAGIAPAVPAAGFLIRLGAHLIDWVLFSLATGVVLTGAFYLHFGQLNPDALPLETSTAQALADFGYFAACEAVFIFLYGATPGKRILKLRVLALDGQPITWKQAALRSGGRLVNIAAVGLPYLLIAFRPDKRGLHDRFAGTIVVRGKGLQS